MITGNLPNRLNRDARATGWHSSDAGGCLRCCDNLDWKNTLQMKLHQERQKRDNQQRKLKRKGNGMKETLKMDPNRFSGGWCRDDPYQWHNYSAGDARISHHIMMVKVSEGGLGTLATRRGLYSATATEGFEHISKPWKLHDHELHLMENKVTVPDYSEDHYGNHGTIIGLLISKREIVCLLSGPRFDEEGGKFTSGNGRCQWIMYSQR